MDPLYFWPLEDSIKHTQNFIPLCTTDLLFNGPSGLGAVLP
jgi:hypothetical protein